MVFGPFRKVKKYASPSSADVTADAPTTDLGRDHKIPSGFMVLANATVTWRNEADQSSETADIPAGVPIMVSFDLITANQIVLVGWP